MIPDAGAGHPAPVARGARTWHRLACSSDRRRPGQATRGGRSAGGSEGSQLRHALGAVQPTGACLGHNRGLECTATRFVAITDDDCLVHVHWVARLGTRLRQHSGSIITGGVEAGDKDTVLFVLTDREPRIQRRPALRYRPVIGANMAVETRTMERLGGLDEDQCVCTAEDGEFAYRALRAGVPIVYDPEIVVTHVGWRDERERMDRSDSYSRSQGGFYGKYLRRGDLFIAARSEPAPASCVPPLGIRRDAQRTRGCPDRPRLCYGASARYRLGLA